MTYGISIEPTLYRGDAAPLTGRLGDMWVDTSTGFPILNFCTATSPLTWTPNGGMRPIRTTKLTTPGSGTHTFLSAGQWVRLTLQAGGGSGGKYNGAYASGGAGGEYWQGFVYIPSASLTYTVGAGGAAQTGNTAGVAGGSSNIGVYGVRGGTGGPAGGTATAPSTGGGFVGTAYADGIGSDVVATESHKAGSICGGYGGASGQGGAGAGVGASWWGNNNMYTNGGTAAGSAGGGGSSWSGLGGNASNTGAVNAGSGGLGAGGGASANTGYSGAGGNGYILIEEFGAW